MFIRCCVVQQCTFNDARLSMNGEGEMKCIILRANYNNQLVFVLPKENAYFCPESEKITRITLVDMSIRVAALVDTFTLENHRSVVLPYVY